MSDEVKNGPELRVGLINEILSEGIFIRVVRALWRFFHLAAIVLLCMNQDILVTVRIEILEKKVYSVYES
jgi:hypothetical protein